ncbi:MAG: hypothetical protein IT365_29400 [Candidatus Hydrogenedentes bacterium]|nr:hypothetical protein [Candidatus Hydrogenedentota bacterium]
MANKNFVNVQGKGPVTKAKHGRFEVSIWHWVKTIAPPVKKEDFIPEREVDVHRACIRHSQFNRRTQAWEESCIWCELDALRDLVQAIDGLNPDE